MASEALDRFLDNFRGKARRRLANGLFAASSAVTRISPPFPGRRPHGLGAPLVVSLTSYPPRFPLLELTLKRLLSQTLAADHTILWLAECDRRALPSEVERLTRHGLEIRQAADTGPHKKYLEARRRHPDAYLVTVDDDMAYRRTMLGDLVAELPGAPRSIITHRARRMVWRDGDLMPYWNWPLVDRGPLTSPDLLSTGSGGVLYPPGSLLPEVLDEALLLRLSPRTDDLWLHWMVRRAGYTTTLVSRPNRAREWDDSQDVALWRGVNQQENDAAIGRLMERFGPPAMKQTTT